MGSKGGRPGGFTHSEDVKARIAASVRAAAERKRQKKRDAVLALALLLRPAAAPSEEQR